MSKIITSRRSLITGLGALFIAAPAIVRASSLMPVKAVKWKSSLDVVNDGLALASTAHPWSNLADVAHDLSEDALNELSLELSRLAGGLIMPTRGWVNIA